MRRDMDLVRRILMVAADASGPVPIEALTSDECPRALVCYHLRIMDEAGLVKVGRLAADGDPCYAASVERLTWEGNDFLDAVRSDTVWSKVKTKVAQAVGSASFEVVKAAAAKVAAEMVAAQL